MKAMLAILGFPCAEDCLKFRIKLTALKKTKTKRLTIRSISKVVVTFSGNSGLCTTGDRLKNESLVALQE